MAADWTAEGADGRGGGSLLLRELSPRLRHFLPTAEAGDYACYRAALVAQLLPIHAERRGAVGGYRHRRRESQAG